MPESIDIDKIETKRELNDFESEILQEINLTHNLNDEKRKLDLINDLIKLFGSDKYNHGKDDPITNQIKMIEKTKKLFENKRKEFDKKAQDRAYNAQIEASHNYPGSYTVNLPYGHGIRTKKRKKTKGKQPKGKQPKGKQTKGKQTKGKKTKGKQPKGKQTKGKQTKGKKTKGKKTKGKQTKGKQTKGKKTKGKNDVDNKLK